MGAICVGVVFGGLGLLLLFSKDVRDISWQWDSWRMRSRGVTSVERTPQWEKSTTLAGVGCIVFGILIIIFSLVAD